MKRRAEPTERPDILIVDDNPLVTGALARIMRQEGYEPAVCHKGQEALDYLERRSPAAAVVDIHLPDFSGFVISSRLRERLGEHLPIIVLSGDTSMENLRQLPNAGASFFMSKPFRSEQLLERLKELMTQGLRP